MEEDTVGRIKSEKAIGLLKRTVDPPKPSGIVNPRETARNDGLRKSPRYRGRSLLIADNRVSDLFWTAATSLHSPFYLLLTIDLRY